jgi:hypothetical protein
VSLRAPITLLALLSLAISISALHATPAWAESAATPSQRQDVQIAIEKAQQFLLSHQNANGNWEEVQSPAKKAGGITDLQTTQWGGLTAVVTDALLASGKNPQGELKEAVAFLLKANLSSTYGIGFASQMALFLPQEKDSQEFVRRNINLLLQGMSPPPTRAGGLGAGGLINTAGWTGNTGFYSYALAGRSNLPTCDRSNTQCAVHAMSALAEAGGDVPVLYWRIEDAAWRKAQQAEGGWSYTSRMEKATPSMTAAGLASLLIARNRSGLYDDARGGAVDANIAAGFRWLDHQAQDQLTLGTTYTLYTISRACSLAGHKYLGEADWYQRGADQLVKHQARDGSFIGIPNTALGLLFLARGAAPVVMNKLQFQSTAAAGANAAEPWNERSGDVCGLADGMEYAMHKLVNWHVVTLQSTQPDLDEAPVLYMAGSTAFDLPTEDLNALRHYLERGGVILGNADGGKPAFSASFEALGTKLFPNLRFEDLSSAHPIYSPSPTFPGESRVKPRLRALGDSKRVFMFLDSTDDLGRSWQRGLKGNEPAFRIGANIIRYAMEIRQAGTIDSPPMRVTVRPVSPLSPVARAALPPEKLVKDAENALHDVYAPYPPANRERQISLARKFVADAAGEMKSDDASSFVLLRAAEQLAGSAGDLDLALDAIGALEQRFDFNWSRDKLAVLEQARTLKLSAPTSTRLIEIGLQLADEGAATEDFNTASKALADASALAAANPDPLLAARIQAASMRNDKLRQTHIAVDSAQRRLKTDPQDPASSDVIGQYLCFIKQAWPAGLPFLAKSGDAKLRSAAKLDAANPTEPGAQCVVADAWWTLAEDRGDHAAALRARAAYWYAKALPRLEGLRRALAEKRVAAANAN